MQATTMSATNSTIITTSITSGFNSRRRNSIELTSCYVVSTSINNKKEEKPNNCKASSSNRKTNEKIETCTSNSLSKITKNRKNKKNVAIDLASLIEVTLQSIVKEEPNLITKNAD
ncbi:hypothetical protein ABK040_004092 [Willaertia magna]